MVYLTATTPIKTVGLREICNVDGHHFKRLRGTQKWTGYTPDNTTSTTTSTDPSSDGNDKAHAAANPLYLSNWSLFLARENEPGDAYAVTGDAECMHYSFSEAPVDLTLSEGFVNIFQLAVITEEQAGIVKEIVKSEVPPSARDRASVKENCEGWAVRVVEGLVKRGVVGESKVGVLTGMLEPV
ncbi:hypothetical protein BDV06DRAFT_216567 [Aspergillus oleicola]